LKIPYVRPPENRERLVGEDVDAQESCGKAMSGTGGSAESPGGQLDGGGGGQFGGDVEPLVSRAERAEEEKGLTGDEYT